MSYSVNIFFKNDMPVTNVSLNSLKSISYPDNREQHITDFSTFVLRDGQYTFIAEDKIISVQGRHILYVEFTKN